jgi:lysophospholipase L1-like esterase
VRAGVVAGVLLTAWAAAGQTDPSQLSREDLLRALNTQHHVLADWAGLNRYGSADTELKAPKPGEDRVVFLGDDVTESWGAAEFFPGKPYINRGIAHQVTPQLLVRFRQDVIELKPKVVVIQAGTNDIAGIMGGGTEGTMAEHFMSMVELAKLHGIRVVLASLTPVCDCYTKQTGRRPIGKLISMNGWIRDYAEKSGSVYLNFYAALAEGREMKKDYTDDGFLPNAKGYAVMGPVAEEAIAKALNSR